METRDDSDRPSIIRVSTSCPAVEFYDRANHPKLERVVDGGGDGGSRGCPTRRPILFTTLL